MVAIAEIPLTREEQVLAWLREVPDPEIPVISVVDLGIVRGVRIETCAAGEELGAAGERCTVVITPTYSGCPAMELIAEEISASLLRHGFAEVAIETVLSPAWSTDWLSDSAKLKLKRYGIAPPTQCASKQCSISRHTEDPVVPCPRCDSTNTVRVSQFGSTACKATYRCTACHEPFDYFKAH